MSGAAASRAMPLSALLAGIETVAAECDRMVSDLTLDSREARTGSCFLAVRGTRENAMRYAGEAAARGAVAVLAEDPEGAAALAIPVIRVPALRRTLGTLANRFFDTPSAALQLFAVTGTNGKTTVAHLTAQALTCLGSACGYIGTLGAGLPPDLVGGLNTTPDVITINRWLARFRAAGAAAAALEASSHALDQDRFDGLVLHAAAFTQLGHDHLDYHGTTARYAAAKRRLFEHPRLHAVVINVDDVWGADLAAALATEGPVLWTCSSGHGRGAARTAARITASGIALAADGLRLQLCADGAQAEVRAPLLGRFNVDNLLVIAGLLLSAGHPLSRVAACLAQLQPVPGRMQACGVTAAGAQVIVDYAHTPDSLAAALASVRELTAGRLHVVFGCGGNRDRSKRPLMGAAAARHADVVTITSDNPRDEDPAAIAAAIRAGIDATVECRVIVDRAQAIAAALAGAARGDCVLIAGKGHEITQEAAGVRRPFDDREIVARVLAERTA